jgi:hypothetical protein
MLVKIKNYVLMGVVACSLSMTACNTAESPTPTPTSPTQALLVSKTWKMSGWTVKSVTTISGLPDNTTNQDLMLDCLKDNTVKYNSDNTLVGDAGAVKCGPDENQTGSGTWQLLENDKKIKIKAINPQTNLLEENTYDVVTLNEQTFTYRLTKEQTVTIPSNPPTTIKTVVSTDVTLSAQ